MLYEFKCRATGNLVMMQPVAERILGLIGKAPGATGVIMPEQMPAAWRALDQAIAAERDAGTPADDGEDESDDPKEAAARISLARRAYPFIEMLKAAHAAGKEITWGV